MAIITFRSHELKETGQSLSLVAIATRFAIEHSYRILIVSTNFKDNTLEDCYWEADKFNPMNKSQGKIAIGVDSGVEGLVKVLASNKTSPEIIKNYSKIILNSEESRKLRLLEF